MSAKHTRLRWKTAAAHALLGAVSIIWLCPFVLLVLQSFRGESGGMTAYVLPRQWTLDNYAFLFQGARVDPARLTATLPAQLLTFFTLAACLGGTVLLLRGGRQWKSTLLLLGLALLATLMRCVDAARCDFLRWFFNTLTIALFCAAIQTAMVLCTAYALSRLRFRGRRFLMNTVLLLGMFPGFLTMIVLYYLLKMLGLTQAGAVPGLILISCASSGMGYYIAKGFFDTIPRALDEAARIDGATRLQVFRRVIMPMAGPVVIYTVLMAFMGPWGDYVFASYVAFGHQESYTVAVGLYRWVNTSDYQGYFTRFCAGGVVVALPVTLLFMALQRYYVEGVTGGAVKG